nr:IS30 family transposase [Ndongobacter massiliensis]
MELWIPIIKDFVEYWRIEKRYSPDAVIMKIENEGLSFETEICTKTLYNYISKDYFLNLTNRNLPRRVKKAKRRYRRVRKSYRTRGKSIDQRPMEANERSEFGHWEMDCVESGRGGRSCLLTVVERQTNYSLNFKLLSQSQKQVKMPLDRMERKLGRPSFPRLFKSITVDNGSEFLDVQSLMSSLFAKKKARTEIYYCHPYSSYERGSNEQMNGQIRRFIPKGTDISKVSKGQVREITNHFNTYLKRSLEGKTFEQLFHQELAKIGIAI